ncbi:Angiotensin-converting enzyme [Portunus trituberculatus]|uniref:Angiotensin-converting enzyme n=1 Tax=Portunus trituberculatus TaxID=210409 RepID=A0A5B7JBJ9_PORTR|nr:Angiotensin-converting enzyme [Portunus trituberculatus]
MCRSSCDTVINIIVTDDNDDNDDDDDDDDDDDLALVVSPEDYNESFWRRRGHYQGVAAPAPRPALAFDPAGKYHVAENIPYLR